MYSVNQLDKVNTQLDKKRPRETFFFLFSFFLKDFTRFFLMSNSSTLRAEFVYLLTFHSHRPGLVDFFITLIYTLTIE